MPRRVDARWGRTGMVRLHGFVKFDNRENGSSNDRNKDEHANSDRGQQGFLLSDPQFDSLANLLDLSESSPRRIQLRTDLDCIRAFVLKSLLQSSQKPTRPEIHKALAEFARRLGVFLKQTAELGSLPDWSLADPAAIENPSPFHVFITLPRRLYSCAERARSEARNDNDRAVSMIALAGAAEGLADILMELDFASQDDVLKHLPWTADYHLDRLDEAVRIVKRLEIAVDEALAAGKKRGGPNPQKDLMQAIVWLGNVFESYGGRFTHNPYVKTEYDGRPHSAAGRFVLEFLRTCDSTISEQAVSQYMAEAIRFKKRARSGQRGNRETSS
jgi:hypothetical protein